MFNQYYVICDVLKPPSLTAAVRCKHEGLNMISSVEPLFLPVNEGFKVISVGRTMGYRLIDEGKIQMVKVGKKSLVSVASLRAFAISLTSQAA